MGPKIHASQRRLGDGDEDSQRDAEGSEQAPQRAEGQPTGGSQCGACKASPPHEWPGCLETGKNK